MVLQSFETEKDLQNVRQIDYPFLFQIFVLQIANLDFQQFEFNGLVKI